MDNIYREIALRFATEIVGEDYAIDYMDHMLTCRKCGLVYGTTWDKCDEWRVFIRRSQMATV